jgi:hypothetical protein
MAPAGKIKLALSTTRRHIEGVEVHLHAFLTSILDAEERFKALERTPVPIDRAGGTQTRSGSFGEHKDLLSLSGFESWIFQPIA